MEGAVEEEKEGERASRVKDITEEQDAEWFEKTHDQCRNVRIVRDEAFLGQRREVAEARKPPPQHSCRIEVCGESEGADCAGGQAKVGAGVER